jgi:hypothetical protein
MAIEPPAFDDPQHWRMRVEEVRIIAEGTRDHISKLILLRIAADYGQLAERMEERANQSETSREVRAGAARTGLERMYQDRSI